MKIPFKESYDAIEIIAFSTLLLARSKIKNHKTMKRQEFVREIIVQMYGGEVETERSGEICPMYYPLVISPDGRPKITISPYASMYRDNFVIMRNLGHLILHYIPSKEETFFGHMDPKKEVDWQANRFAAAFLMPYHEFLKKRKEYKDNTSLLSGYFEVPWDDVDRRKEYVNAK